MTVEILQSEISTAGVNAHQERNHRACGDAWAVLLVQTGLSSQAGTGPEVPISFPFRIAHQGILTDFYLYVGSAVWHHFRERCSSCSLPSVFIPVRGLNL